MKWVQLCGSLSILWHCLSGIGMKTDLFQSCGHCWVFQICWHIECSTFTASSFRTWNKLNWNSITSTSFVHSDHWVLRPTSVRAERIWPVRIMRSRSWMGGGGYWEGLSGGGGFWRMNGSLLGKWVWWRHFGLRTAWANAWGEWCANQSSHKYMRDSGKRCRQKGRLRSDNVVL